MRAAVVMPSGWAACAYAIQRSLVVENVEVHRARGGRMFERKEVRPSASHRSSDKGRRLDGDAEQVADVVS
jgi:hypothetical protein